MIRILFAFLLAMAGALHGAGAQDVVLTPGAPARYVVQPGDTLWGISGKFLRDPWLWPDIWRMNREELRNPHLLYPGDVILLDRDADGKPRLRLQEVRLKPRIYAEGVSEVIPAIPPNLIRPFLSDPLVVENDELDTAARIIATAQDRVNLGNGDRAYVANANPAQRDWQVYRNARPLRDPETGDILGYEAFYLGTARQIEPGEPATFEIVTAKQEVGRGDRLLPAVRPPLVAYAPHRPDFPVYGRIISIYGGVEVAGRGSIVAINRGTSDGIEIGHVLAIERNRTVVARDESDRRVAVTIPPERSGLLFVFRTFSRISYALIVQSEGTVDTNDFVRTP
ncbi:LysM peptidoglycan-binding domain-containing protein [Accumulibacter sp.]|uniref:LysM peptidoglycan-binding domain-containing protein n=1 Tax=Accumulibacter sp. TaxID=2053492 RepID=UPI0025EFFFF1|nr:LysM peptidoglycan-binding domain-containing protein [Accumulibacter sp.]MCM8594672.1 LysM peptidoglycan-binding domain-containing protein [Accumulibacter sp.]MCM8625912.1 LysM peptidoglycan-binding domain-containing protein [Accumulibacter sp.]MDS4048818.1 LysM peptidoglycan-binding domain-containing protein [Accumulibacter sp.]